MLINPHVNRLMDGATKLYSLHCNVDVDICIDWHLCVFIFNWFDVESNLLEKCKLIKLVWNLPQVVGLNLHLLDPPSIVEKWQLRNVKQYFCHKKRYISPTIQFQTKFYKRSLFWNRSFMLYNVYKCLWH